MNKARNNKKKKNTVWYMIMLLFSLLSSFTFFRFSQNCNMLFEAKAFLFIQEVITDQSF
ncbi:unnamed protein product, partial [Boreogadus saida]